MLSMDFNRKNPIFLRPYKKSQKLFNQKFCYVKSGFKKLPRYNEWLVKKVMIP